MARHNGSKAVLEKKRKRAMKKERERQKKAKANGLYNNSRKFQSVSAQI